METTTDNTQVARTIIAQIGRRARMEMGLRDFLSMSDGLVTKCGMGHSTTLVTIALDPSDTYTITFTKVNHPSRGGSKVLATVDDVYCDVLGDILVSTWCSICSERGW